MPNDKWQVSLATAKRLALRFPGVTGVDYGYKYHAGVRSSRLCVRFHVSRKLSQADLRPHEILPAELGAVACDVVEANYAPRPDLSAGTRGAIVREAGRGRPCVLASWHALCGTSAALERWLDLAQGYDAAIEILSADVAHDGSIADTGIRISGVEEPRLGLAVVKPGAASGLTRAVVDGIEGTFELDYGGYGDQKRWMDGFRLIADLHKPTDAAGEADDAGAVWINPQTQRAVALHFADGGGAGPMTKYAIAHPLSRILNLLDLTF
jgi:hypothetical protein